MDNGIVNIITIILKESATAALAAFAIWELRNSYQRRLEDQQHEVDRWKAQMECERQDKLMLNETLQQVAQRMGEMSEVLRSYRTNNRAARP